MAALSGPADADCLSRGLEELRRLGFDPIEAPNLGCADGPFAGSDRERLDGFHRLAADADVRAIFFLRGGHGSLRLLEKIDWDLLASRPRAYVGYSDLTPFLLQVVTRLGLVALHGPMVAVEMARGLEAAEERALMSLLGGEESVEYDLQAVAPGSPVSGPLLGGCLSLLAAMLGTSYQLNADGAILFWEDVDEPFYRVDRMLTQLRLSGSVSALSGMVSGRVGLEPLDLDRLRDDFECVFASGLSSGHCQPNLPLPLGAMATIDPAAGSIRFDPKR